jgi:hypothetical protein
LVDHLHAWLSGNEWLATWILAAGVAFAAIALWDSHKTRDGELLADLSRRWSDASMEESMMAYSLNGPSRITALARILYAAAPEAPPPTPDELLLFTKLTRWPLLIESIGVIHSHGSISTRAVYKMWGPGIIAAWTAWSAPVATLRKIDGYPATFPYFEKLAKKMRNRNTRWYWRALRRLRLST